MGYFWLSLEGAGGVSFPQAAERGLGEVGRGPRLELKSRGLKLSLAKLRGSPLCRRHINDPLTFPQPPER